MLQDRDIPLDLGKGTEKSQKTRLGQGLSRMRDRRFTLLEGGQVKLTPVRTVKNAARYSLEKVNQVNQVNLDDGEPGEPGEPFPPDGRSVADSGDAAGEAREPGQEEESLP